MDGFIDPRESSDDIITYKLISKYVVLEIIYEIRNNELDWLYVSEYEFKSNIDLTNFDIDNFIYWVEELLIKNIDKLIQSFELYKIKDRIDNHLKKYIRKDKYE